MAKVGRKSKAGEAPLCTCGCGQPTNWLRGRGWGKWVHGHHIRVKNPNTGDHVRGDKSPMKRPEVVAKVSGDNHWRHRPENAERAREYAEEQRERYTGHMNPNWKGGRAVTEEGYILVRVDGEYKREHRVIMEQYLGRKLNNEEVIHHINGDITDNRIENLSLMKGGQSQHASMHNRIIKRKLPAGLPPLCICGCGQRIEENKRHRGTWNWFVLGHSNVLRIDGQFSEGQEQEIQIKKTPVPKKKF